jgi:hypothetical protein
MNRLIRLRRKCCTAVVVLTIVLQQMLFLPTTAVFIDVDVDKCIVLCARENHAFTANSAQELQPEPQHTLWKHQSKRSECQCNSESRILQQQGQQPKHRKEVDESPGLIVAPDDYIPTASPTGSDSQTGPDSGGMGIETTFSPRPVMAPLPSSPSTSPRPVVGLTSTPIEQSPQLPTSTVSPHPSVTPIMQPPQLPTTSPRPTVLKLPSSSEAPSISPKPTVSRMPIQIPVTSTLSPKPLSQEPTHLLETESPTDMKMIESNDDYDGETNHNEPSLGTPSPNTEVTTPEKTNNQNSNSASNLSGGGKFGIVLVVGILLGVIGVGYATIQRRLRNSYHGTYSSTYGMNNAETELGLWESNARHRHGNDDDDGLL